MNQHKITQDMDRMHKEMEEKNKKDIEEMMKKKSIPMNKEEK